MRPFINRMKLNSAGAAHRSPVFAALRRILLACLLLTGSSCAHTAIVKTWEPAEIEVSGIERIVVLDFAGEGGKHAARVLAGKLGTNEFYTVVESQQLGTQVQLAAYAEPTESPADELLAVASAHSVDAVIRGEVIEYSCEDQHFPNSGMNMGTGIGRDANQRGYAHSSAMLIEGREIVERRAVVTIAVQLVDVRSGEILVSRRFSHRFEDRSMGGVEQFPSEQDILNNLLQRCLNDLTAMLAPHETTCQIKLATCDLWVRGRREVKLGAKLAEAGDWEAAEQRWRDALQVNPHNHAALFNLAVEADHRQMYSEAEELAMQALRLNHRVCYAEGLKAIRAHRQAFEKSEDQREARITTASNEVWE
ncbi:CsgG/HfaB family protein [Planctomicrobium sp. SH664]|uniref:CsgG/HfaB family protein n=1 Tax=Planctomicrobium sp. SH664 TaxID=3448125 RepID=UPI003F5BFF8C